MLDPDIEAWANYLETCERAALADAIQRYPKETNGLTIDARELAQRRPDLADHLHEHPEAALDDAAEAVPHCDVPHAEQLEGIDVRVGSVPTREFGLSDLRSAHQGELVTVRAQVSKVTDVRPRIVTAAFACLKNDTCHYRTEVPVHTDEIRAPQECGGCGSKGPFQVDESASDLRDHQIVELQPRPDEDAMNLQRSLPVHLWDDLVDSVEAGERVKATGILKTEAIGTGDKVDARRPQYLDGLSIEKEQQDFDSYDTDRVDEIEALAARDDLQDQLVASFAEDILTGDRGDVHKLACLLQMFGGVRHRLANGDEKRGDINILLIGAPGTGKSAFLNAANTLAPKSIKASGKGATAAGLTATAVQPDFGDGWMLDAGALVMASGGLACIDEFDKMADSARKSMHEAMEDQEIPINKAGINTTLTSKTAVLAAANPEGGSFDRYTNVAEQINLGEALISRFDLVFALEDTPDADADREIAEHQYRVTRDGSVEPAIDPDLLREYIAFARQTVTPAFDDDEAVGMLVDKYVETRQANDDDDDPAVPVTARMNESLRRLAEAAARAELSDVVRPRHAETAIHLYKMTIGDIGLTEDGSLSATKMSGVNTNGRTQQDKRNLVKSALRSADEDLAVAQLAERTGLDTDEAEHHLKHWLDKGHAYEPKTGAYRWA